MITKCDHLNCTKSGTCRCPKDRSLKTYWNFCTSHAAEYNKNWNYYAGMTQKEIDKEWEKDTFGDANETDNSDYQKLIFDFVNGKTKIPPKTKSIPSDVVLSLKTLGLSGVRDWASVQKKYRALAKREHPDTKKSCDHSEFSKINSAYQTLKKYFKK